MIMSCVDILNKGQELKPYFELAAENKEEGMLEKEKGLVEFLKKPQHKLHISGWLF